MSPLAGAVVAIANRGEIAVRIAATCRRLGAVPVALLGDPDLDGFAARRIGRVEPLGPAGAEFDPAAVVAAAQRAGAAYLHPGYGFLSERAALAEACAAAGLRFVGPSPETLRVCGDKLATRAAAQAAGAPLLPASPPLGADPFGWAEAADRVGYPLLVKPAGAGGGRGLRRVADPAALPAAVAASRREGAESGAGDAVYLERELADARHVEVQVAADGTHTLALGDRDCSLQRRAQKVIEEAPAPGLPPDLRAALHGHARRIAEAVGLRGLATCEFLLGADGALAFLEVNPRIQVEHPVTEAVTGLDLVEWQLRLAAGEPLPLADAPAPRGHAVEARVYAEDPWAAFFPAAGRLAAVAWPAGPEVRVDAGYAAGDAVPSAYDAMLAKVVARGPDRAAALAALRLALRETVVAGLPTNLPWLLALLDAGPTRAGRPTVALAQTVPPTLPDRALALAAAAAHTLAGTDRDPTDPWAAVGPFRLASAAGLAFHGDDRGEAWEERVALTHGPTSWELTRAGTAAPLRWWRDDDGTLTVSLGQDVARFAVVAHDDGLEVAGNGGRWLLRAGPRPTARAAAGPRAHDGRVRAPMPARVLRVGAAPGDRVARGHPLVTLTAMKMELACEAPAPGVVESVSCQPDQLVDADALLVTLRLDAPDPPGAVTQPAAPTA